MRVMLDTNILISIAIFNSEQLKNLLEHICKNYQLVISSTIIEEVKDVVERKFPDKQESMETFLYKIPYEYEYVPDTIINTRTIEIRDPKDTPILYSAIVYCGEKSRVGCDNIMCIEKNVTNTGTKSPSFFL